LDRLPIPNKSKTLIGFSDATAINLFVSQKWPHWRIIHAPVLAHLDGKDFSKDKFATLLDILENKINSYEISEVFPLNRKARASKKVVGKLTGGNLAVIESGLKTCWEIQTDGKILFLEDVYEGPARVYRSLYHLKEAGKLSNAKALVFGHFHESGDRRELMRCLKAFSSELQIPVYVTERFGHGDRNMPLIYDATAELRDYKMLVKI
jgi:muramoyltetrapeptide carboxypeptidase